MNDWRLISRFARDRSAASSVEFALVVVPFLLFLLGTLDVGRFIWLVNENEKAAQSGARFAVVTDTIPGGEIGCDEIGAETAGLRCFSYSINGIVNQGLPVPEADFPNVTCSAPSGTLSCNCEQSCPFSTAIDTVAQNSFDALIDRMRRIQPRLGPENVSIEYAWSGLGYSGDPNGADVSPTITVKISDLDFRPLFLANQIGFSAPGAEYSLTMEDAEGSFAN